VKRPPPEIGTCPVRALRSDEEILPEIPLDLLVSEPLVHLEVGREPQTMCVLTKETRTEPVDCRHGREREIVECFLGTPGHLVPVEALLQVMPGACRLLPEIREIVGLRQELEAARHPQTHLRRGLLREGDRRNGAQGKLGLDHLVQQALDEEASLPRPCTRDDHDVSVVSTDGALPSLCVRVPAHWGSPAISK
jgi:hypothetical protein